MGIGGLPLSSFYYRRGVPTYRSRRIKRSLMSIVPPDIGSCILCYGYPGGYLKAIMIGAISMVLADQFPISVRSTGLALSYITAVMLFGGFAQFIVTWLIQVTGMPLASAFYVSFGAIPWFLGTLGMMEDRDSRTDTLRPTVKRSEMG